jgi:hypothetical protein
MSDADTHALIGNLQRSNRFWKKLALGLLAALGLTILLLSTSAAVLSIRIVQQRRQAEAAEVEAQRQFQESRKALEGAWREADKLQQKGRRP